MTDGASVMSGKNMGLLIRTSNVASKTNTLDGIIHQSVLYTKLSGELKEVMGKIMKKIHNIRGNLSKQHHLFCNIDAQMASHNDQLLHNGFCWLSKGKALDSEFK